MIWVKVPWGDLKNCLPSDRLQSNYGGYRRGKCQRRNCVDNWLTDCNQQWRGHRCKKLLDIVSIWILSLQILLKTFLLFGLATDCTVAAMEADCSCSHRNHCLGRKAKPHKMYKGEPATFYRIIGEGASTNQSQKLFLDVHPPSPPPQKRRTTTKKWKLIPKK